jgi:hypothetical protein
MVQRAEQDDGISTAVGERRQLLLHLDASLIKDLKRAAVDLETTASAIANDALELWLTSRNLRRTAHPGSGSPEISR